MDHHVDLLRREAEQPAALDDLQRLVHHRGRVDRNFRAHGPGGVRQGVVDRDLPQLVAGQVAERSAAGGQDDAGDFLAAAGLQGLKNRAVLAVDRQDRRAALGGQLA